MKPLPTATTGETPVLRRSDVAKISDALKKYQAEQARAEQAAMGVPLAAPVFAPSPPASPRLAPPSVVVPACPGTLVLSETLLPHHDRGGRIADAYRALRTNLLARCGEQGFCSLVTSARPGEGKTLTAANLALVLAECVTQNVLLIDADLRRPRVAGLMGLPSAPGLAEWIRGEATLRQVLQPTTYKNLSVIAAGSASPGDVAELLARPPVHTLLAEAKRLFTHVLIDTPPIHLSDVGTLGQVCRQALLVVRAGRTRQEDVTRAVALLHAANIQPAGMVLTGERGRL